MAVSRQPMPLPTAPFPHFSPAHFRFSGGGGGLFQSAEKTPHYPPLCVTVTLSTPEAVPFAEEMFYFIFAEEIWKLEASLQRIGAGVRPPGLNSDRSSD